MHSTLKLAKTIFMKKNQKNSQLFILVLILLSGISTANAFEKSTLKKRNLCVFDIIGKQGEAYSAMEDYRLEAMKWGVDFTLKAYTDEKIASEDFKAKHCDAVSLTGLRGRNFNAFTGTLDSIGSIPTYQHMRITLQKLASPTMSKFMRSGDYEVIGIIPGGAGYLFVNDRTINTVGKMSGKKVAVLDFDLSQAIMVSAIGASPVSSTIATFGPMFNNGSVDIIAAPAIAYEPLELYKGLGDKGAIARQAIGQLTFQILMHHERFPDAFGQHSRTYIWNQYENSMALINKSTNKIPPHHWMEIPEADKIMYAEMFRQSRLKLKSMGFYHGKMLTFLSRVRCKVDPQLAECTAPDRE